MESQITNRHTRVLENIFTQIGVNNELRTTIIDTINKIPIEWDREITSDSTKKALSKLNLHSGLVDYISLQMDELLKYPENKALELDLLYHKLEDTVSTIQQMLGWDDAFVQERLELLEECGKVYIPNPEDLETNASFSSRSSRGSSFTSSFVKFDDHPIESHNIGELFVDSEITTHLALDDKIEEGVEGKLIALQDELSGIIEEINKKTQNKVPAVGRYKSLKYN